MRIVAIADTHLYQDDLGTLPEGDVLVHAGDLLQRGSLDELEGAIAWLAEQPHAHKLLVAGNHDVCFEREPEVARARVPEGIHYLQDDGITLEGVTFWGSPWQPAYNDWAFNLPRGEALARKWAQIPEGTDVLITHGPPRGFGDTVLVAGRQGCQDLMARVLDVRPRLHLFGHIHHDGGAWRQGEIVLANVTTWESERGATVIDLELAQDPAVTLIEVPPAQADPDDRRDTDLSEDS